MVARTAWLAVALVALSCSSSGDDDKGKSDPQPATKPSDAAPAKPALPKVAWKRHTIDGLNVSLDVFAGDADEPSISEGYTMQRHGPVSFAVQWGSGVGITSYKRMAGKLPGQTISATQPTELCGRTAKRIIVSRPDRGTIRGKHHRKRMPAVVVHMVEVRVGMKDALFSFSIEADKEKRYRQARTHFFDSVKCR